MVVGLGFFFSFSSHLDPRGCAAHGAHVCAGVERHGVGVGEPGRLQDGPGELVHLEGLQRRRRVADRAPPPGVLRAGGAEEGLQVEALQVPAVRPASRKGHPTAGQRAQEGHLQ